MMLKWFDALKMYHLFPPDNDCHAQRCAIILESTNNHRRLNLVSRVYFNFLKPALWIAAVDMQL
jgi:hypothetical protein